MINQVHTSCKDCIFAEYEGITQTGCKTRHLDKLREHEIEILEVFDEEKEFYVINKTKCLYKRLKTWSLSDAPLDEQIKNIEQRLSLKFNGIVIANDNLEDIKKTIDSLLAQTLQPVYITILRKLSCKIMPLEIFKVCKDLTIRWRVENALKDVPDIELLDLIVPFVSTTNMSTMFQAGFIVPPTTFATINNAIHEEFRNITILTPNLTNNGFTVPSYIHKMYQGSYEKPLLDKVKADECPYIFPIHQIVTDFPE